MPFNLTKGQFAKLLEEYKKNNNVDISNYQSQNNDKQKKNTLSLYQWQQKAYQQWANCGYQGIIEAVTGAGKTRIAHKAIFEHINRGWKILIIVPNIELQTQWYNDLVDLLGERDDLRRLGNGYHGQRYPDPNWKILIAVVNSAIGKPLRCRDKGLLIADECHHYGAKTFSAALKDCYTKRLGLTATYERNDDGIENYLNPYFGSVCYRYGYDQALRDNVIAHFKIAFIGIKLTRQEQNEYERYNKQCIIARRRLNRYGLGELRFGEFFKKVSELAKGASGDFNITMAASTYISNFSKRRQVLANSVVKYDFAKHFVKCIQTAERTIVFCQTQRAASKLSDIFSFHELNSQTINANVDQLARRKIFKAFETGKTEVITAPLLLDEGINVPSADLAIIIASSRSKRQMIQRMGRVIRRKTDRRLARIAVLYAKDTSEDPRNGAYEDFLDDIKDAADDRQYFDENKIIALQKYLNSIR
ncbi:DNA repair helicase [Spirochaetia bacterium]|nr:DNA repair helicase [Spirochaetia bacterium]